MNSKHELRFQDSKHTDNASPLMGKWGADQFAHLRKLIRALHCPSLWQSPVFTDARASCHVAYEWKIKIWFMIGEACQYEKGKMYITHELFNLSKMWGQRTGRNKKTRKNCCYYWIQFLHLTRKGHFYPSDRTSTWKRLKAFRISGFLPIRKHVRYYTDIQSPLPISFTLKYVSVLSNSTGNKYRSLA